MPIVNFFLQSGELRVVQVPSGSTVMQAAQSDNIAGISAECGGSMMCATCHVIVDASWLDKLPLVSKGEDEMLDCTETPRTPASRLGCQLVMKDEFDGIIVAVPG